MSHWILWTSDWGSAAVRTLMAILIGITVALTWRWYVTHRPSRPPLAPVVGQTLVLGGLLWAQARRIADPEMNPSGVIILLGVAVTLWALLGTMRIHLFRQDGWTVGPTAAEESRLATSAEVERIGEVVDRVEGVVNSREAGEPTLSEDVATSRRRDEAADAAALDESTSSPPGAADRAAAATSDEEQSDE